MNLFPRLRRHLSFANVVACLALFVALGGSAYAGSKINGNRIAQQSIGGGKLKNETITNRQIKKGSLNSSVINVATLATVPSAQTAASATSAGSANTANSAKTADSATTAGKATSAETAAKATNAEHATSADVAGQATSADTATTAGQADTAGHATSADTATTAAHANTAGDAASVNGETAADLTDSCPPDTTLFGGMCWDDSVRPTVSWIVASKECGDLGGRLPSVSELIAYVLQEGIQVGGHVWSADVADASGAEEVVVTSDETTRGVSNAGSAHGYRCLFYRTNAG